MKLHTEIVNTKIQVFIIFLARLDKYFIKNRIFLNNARVPSIFISMIKT